MVLVSHAHQFVYIKTHKTAGTSIEMFLEPFCHQSHEPVSEIRHAMVSPQGIVGRRVFQAKDLSQLDKIWFNHMPPQDVRARLGARIFDRYLKIASVRNPFERAVSHYYFRVRRGLHHEPGDINAARSGFHEFLRSDHYHNDWPTVSIADRIVIDRFIRYEHMATDLSILSDQLGLDLNRTRLPAINVSSDLWLGSVTDHYDDDTANFVRTECAWMFDAGGYEEDPVDTLRTGSVELGSGPPPVTATVDQKRWQA